jgi:hypothetical protein
VLGDADVVRETLAAEPAAAVAIDDARGWPPLLYACYSRWHQIEPGRAAGLAEVVGVLLSAGASPDTNDGGRARYRSALKGSVEVNNPGITAALLDAGASSDRGQPIGRHPDLPGQLTGQDRAVIVDGDLGLLGSLLHPEVQWTGLCSNSEQVLDWYRALLADGIVATVHSVEVDRDAVVLGLAVARKAEGARPAPAQQLYQVFIVDGTLITGIRGARAISRSRHPGAAVAASSSGPSLAATGSERKAVPRHFA